MLTTEIEAIRCTQVRPYRKEVTLRLHLLQDGQEVRCEDYTEPLGDAQTAGSLLGRFKGRMQAAVEKYQAEQHFLETPEVAQLIADLKSGMTC